MLVIKEWKYMTVNDQKKRRIAINAWRDVGGPKMNFTIWYAMRKVLD